MLSSAPVSSPVHRADDGDGRPAGGNGGGAAAASEHPRQPHVALDQEQQRQDGERDRGRCSSGSALLSVYRERQRSQRAWAPTSSAAPKSRMVAGTIRTRTSVASSATAIAIPTPMALTTRMWARANAANTATMIAAALVMRLAGLLQTLGHGAARLSRVRAPLLAHAREHQDLVVHRQAEERAEQEDRERRLERSGLEVEQPAQMALLEDPHQRAEARGDGEEVHHHRLRAGGRPSRGARRARPG